MNVISSDVEINKYEHLGVKSDYLVNALKQLDMPLFLGFFKQLKEEVKIKSDDIDEEVTKYIKNKVRLHDD